MTRMRLWSIVAAACVALPVAAAAVALSVVDPERFKAPLIDAVGDATGRTLALDGPLRIRWSLSPTLQVNDVRLANAAGGSRPDMARAERIEAQISLPSLLLRRLEVLHLTLTGPNILFESVDGRSNWIFDAPGGAADAAPHTSGSPFSLTIRDVQVVNGMVTSRLPARTRVVGLRSLELRHEDDGGPLDLAGVFVYGDNQPFSLQATAVPTAGVHGPWTTRLAFAAFDTAATAVGAMTLAGDYDLQVEARAGAVEKLNALLPEMRLPAVHGATLSAHLVNGPVLGSLPTVGPARLTFEQADLRSLVAGLVLGKVQASLPAAGGQAAVSGQGSYAGLAFAVSGTAGVPLHPDGRASVPIDLAWSSGAGGGSSLSLKGRVDLSTLAFAGLDAQASLRVRALAALRPATSPALPHLEDVRFDGQVTVPTGAGAMRVRQARLSTSAGDLSGDATFGGPGLAVEARLRSTRLDLDAVLAAFDGGVPAPTLRNDGKLIPDIRLPWVADLPAADLALDIGSVTLAGQAWSGLALTADTRGGRRMATARMALPGGPMELSFKADAGAGPVSVTIHARALPLSVLASHAGLPGPTSGSLRLDAELRGAGTTLRQLAGSLNGPVSVTAVGGQLGNRAFLELAGAATKALGIAVPLQGETELRCLGLIGTFANGVLGLPTIALESTYLSLDGTGRIDLANETVALKVHPLTRVGGSPVAVPVIVEGPFSAVGGHLDATGLDKLGLLIDGWFGGDEPHACREAGLDRK